jgi:pyrimidine-specific ribonucleoside hydrolase
MHLIFEMETSDPDDFMTLLWVADHPKIHLLGVVLTPGSEDQVRLVRWGLDLCGRQDVPVGAHHGPGFWKTADGQRPRVSGFHYKEYGEVARTYPLQAGDGEPGPALMRRLLTAFPDTTVLVGSPPKNTGAVLPHPIRRWVQQGGFAGDNIVASPLDKFRGKLTCPSFNPGGAPSQTMALLGSPDVAECLFVSKNVCHGVVWDNRCQRLMRDRMVARPGLCRMADALDGYLLAKGQAKAMHDLVAAACALDESVCEFRRVDIYRQKGEWGATENPLSKTRISVGFDEAKFIDVLAGL